MVSRLWRGDGAMLPDGSTKLSSGDRILVIAKKKDIPELTIFFGKLDNTDGNKSVANTHQNTTDGQRGNGQHQCLAELLQPFHHKIHSS